MRNPLLLWLAALSAPAWAQDPGDLFGLSLDELLQIEVESASKRSLAVSDVPASVIVLTREDIEIMGYLTLEELLENVPGFYLVDNYEDMLVGVRGALSGGLQLLVNGVPQHPSRIKGSTMPERARLNIPVQSIDRIEIIRGPMSVMYGNNAFLGSVNVITREVGEVGSALSISVGSGPTGRSFIRLGRQFEDGYVAFNWGFYSSHGITGDLADTMSADQLDAMHPDMLTQVDGLLGHSDTSFDVSAGYGDVAAHLRYSDMNYGIYALTPSFDQGNRLALNTLHAAVTSEHELLERLTLKTLLGYGEETYHLDFDVVEPDRPAAQFQGTSATTLEVDVVWVPLDWADLVAGYRYGRVDRIHNDFRIPAVQIDLYRETEDVEQHEFLFQGEVRPVRALHLVAGVRGTATQPYSVWEYRDLGPDSEAQWEELPVVEELRLDVVPRLATVVHLGEHHVLKGMWGEAVQDHRQPELSGLERVSTLEVDYTLAYPALSLQVSGFRNDSRGLLRKVQFIDPDTGQYAYEIDDSGHLLTWGAEGLLRARPHDTLDLSASATWQRTQDRENPGIEAGYSPELLAKGSVRWCRGALSAALFSSYVGHMHPDWRWTDQQGQWERIGDDVPGYALLGADVGWRHPTRGYFASVHGSNLLGADYRYPATELVGWQGGGFGRGRQVVLTVGWDQR